MKTDRLTCAKTRNVIILATPSVSLPSRGGKERTFSDLEVSGGLPVHAAGVVGSSEGEKKPVAGHSFPHLRSRLGPRGVSRTFWRGAALSVSRP